MKKIIAIVVITIAVWFVACCVWWGWQGYINAQHVDVVIIFPDNFHGLARLKLKPSIWQIKPRSGILVLHFPTSGILEIKGSDPFTEWHTTSAKFESGKQISIYYDHNDSKDEISLHEIGSLANGSEAWLFVGTETEANAISKQFVEKNMSYFPIQTK